MVALTASIWMGCGPASGVVRVVTSGGDSGPGTLRNTVADAAPGDTVQFDPSVPLVTLTSGPIVIDKDLKIINSLAAHVEIRRGAGAAPFGLIEVFGAGPLNDMPVDVTLHGLTLFNGATLGSLRAGGVTNVCCGNIVRISSTWFNENEKDSIDGGGAILNFGDMRLSNSTLSNNTAHFGSGGAISHNATTALLTVSQSAFVNNVAAVNGGAIANNGTMSLALSIFCDNTANSLVGGGGGIANAATIHKMVSNALGDNMAASRNGHDLLDLGTIQDTTLNVVEDPSGHSLPQPPNVVGIDSGVCSFGMFGAPFPTVRFILEANDVLKDQGASDGAAFDGNGGLRSLGAGPDVGPSESGNRHRAAPGVWDDPLGWHDSQVPGQDDAAFVNRDVTVDSSDTMVAVRTLGVGWGGGHNAAGRLIGDEIDWIITERLAIGAGDPDLSHFTRGEGAVDVTGAIRTNHLNIGTTSAGKEQQTGEASGELILGDDPNNRFTVVGQARIGVAQASGVGASAVSNARFEIRDGQAAEFQGSIVMGQALAGEDSAATDSDVDVDIRLRENMTSNTRVIGSAVSFGGLATVERVHVRIDAEQSSGAFVTIGTTETSAFTSDTPHTRIDEARYTLNALSYQIGSQLRVGTVSNFNFSDGGGMAEIGAASAELNVRTLAVGQGIDVGTVNGDGANTMSHITLASLTVNGADSTAGAPINVGRLGLNGAAGAMVDQAALHMTDGTLTMTGQVANLGVATVNAFSPLGTVRTTAAVTLERMTVTIGRDVDLATVTITTTEPGSYAYGSLNLIDSEVHVGGDVRAALNPNGISDIDLAAFITLNPSLLAIQGDLMLGARAATRFTLAGITRPAAGAAGEYGAIDADDAHLDGQLTLTLSGDYQPTFGDSLTLIQAQSAVHGVFAAVHGVDAPNGLALAVRYAIDAVSVEPTIPGDLNGDGTVTISDLAAMATFFGTTDHAVWAKGDVNGDGGVTIADLARLAVFFGSSVADLQPAATDVPAPTAVMPLLTALAMARRCRRD